MRRILLYLLTLGAVALTACRKDADPAAAEGGIVLRLTQRVSQAASRAVDWTQVTIDDCTLYLYSVSGDAEAAEQTLIRKYAPGDAPATIRLLAGSYRARVEWGETPDAAAFDRCYYEGSADFTVTAGRTEQVEVHCYPQNAVVQVTFELLDAAVSNPSVTMTLEEAPASAANDSLTFTQDETGYFAVPDGGGWLSWRFEADHARKGEIRQTGRLAVEGGKKYALAYRYSEDLPGYIWVEIIELDLSEDQYHDVFVFSPDPEIKGDIFNAPFDFSHDEEVSFVMQANGESAITRGCIYRVDAAGNETLLWCWPDDQNDTGKIQASLSADGKQLDITLAAAFFSFTLGENALRCEVTDSSASKSSKTATVRMTQGLYPLEPDDWSLWSNSLTARAHADTGVPVFRLRETDAGEWITLPSAETAPGEYSAEFAPAWESSYNEAVGVDVYRLQQGIRANRRYELEVELEGHTYATTLDTACDQAVPGYNASSACFTESNRFHGPNDYWGSGNNEIAKPLCTYAVFDGIPCAHLHADYAGMLGINMLAAGNFFTGTFYRPSTQGSVYFGIDYNWQARPTALHLKYHASIGKVRYQKYKLANGQQPLDIGVSDISVIYVAIVDWDAPHEVASGMSNPSGMWSPDETNDPGEGPVIGYGIVRLDESNNTEGDKLVDLEIPIFYYDREAKPSKAYKLVISSSTSYYGDYMCGCDTNELYLGDYYWVY